MTADPSRVRRGRLDVAEVLHRFVEDECLPGTGVDPDVFWAGLEAAVVELGPRNAALLARRDELQRTLDDHHRAAPGRPVDPTAYEEFLRGVGYLVEAPAPFEVTTSGVDTEMATLAGPQLVVPLLNTRFVANAANARWGSLYDALYVTDVIPATSGLERGNDYNPVRGAKVVERVRAFLDQHFALERGSHAEVTAYEADEKGLVAILDGDRRRLADPEQFVGHAGDAAAPEVLVLVHHGLHVELVIDRAHPVGALDRAGVADVLVEAALTAIMDLEDSVAAVDAADKVVGYRNWLGLMQGSLTADVTKDGATVTRTMAADRVRTLRDGGQVELHGRPLLLVRHVGLHMLTGAVLLDGRDEVPEGIVDAFVTALAGAHDLRGASPLRNSRTGSMYVVKPKLHGPEEVAFATEVFARVEDVLGWAPATVKIGIMDEERRTSVNLAACLAAARDRVVFINTGFLDRTGDELHTSMHAGPMVRKNDMKSQPWIQAYEDANVDIGLACGLSGRGQIGKGMWAAPDDMAQMLEQKIAHPRSGATTAWVPSPRAATLHALHYHEVDVWARQRELAGRQRTVLADLLTIPLGDPAQWSAQERRNELDNNVQSTVAYVVRWIDAGTGCSKVPDLNGTPLMEDRATLRISCQHVTNWLLHGVVDRDQVEDSLRRMAAHVDEQNGGDPDYVPMSPSYDTEAFRAASDLLLGGLDSPNGYTEPVLHRRRLNRKAQVEGVSA